MRRAGVNRRAGRGRGGYLIVDVLLGLSLVAGLIVVVQAGAAQYRGSALRLAQVREAVRVAEGVLTDLQAGAGDAAERARVAGWAVEVEAIEAAGGPAWVTVRVERGAATAELTGVAGAAGGVGVEATR